MTHTTLSELRPHPGRQEGGGTRTGFLAGPPTGYAETEDVLAELTLVPPLPECCARTEATVMLHMVHTLHMGRNGLVVRCETPRYEAAYRLAALIRSVWTHRVVIRMQDDGVTMALDIEQEGRNLVRLAGLADPWNRPHVTPAVEPSTRCCAIAALRGAFLVSGHMGIGRTFSRAQFDFPHAATGAFLAALAQHQLGSPLTLMEREGKLVLATTTRQLTAQFLEELGAPANASRLGSSDVVHSAAA
ncbi:hypothetical protein ACIQWN_32350 [Streptomyces vinaceus]|uniref:hypothetical protein n=1 Tax=Streptomyces vinaceus TaxID=1960 RepID=UPI00380CCD18